ncbi:MAG: MCE family protein [Candidatus Adiutrix sp.]|jgi:phospholipid/cholesterol/gamma-HCH transport system substrate-binding protein|nr:MCE family protein [Candidatus Adiutrix sp.]
MYKSSTEIKVGLFVLAAIGVLIWMAVRLGGLSISSHDTYRVSAIFPSALGLKQGVAVEVAGIQVGSVAQIELYDNHQARVVMAIRQGILLPQDSAAYIRASGVLGDKYVELVPGGPTSAKLEDNGVIANARASADISELMEKLGEIAEDIKKITSPLAEGNLGEDVRDMVVNLRDMSQRLDGIVKTNESGLKETLDSLKIAMENLKDITEKINAGEGSLGRLVNDDSTVRELNASLAALRNISGKISSGEGTLGRLVNDDSTIDKIDQALSGINNYLEKEDKFKVFVEYRTAYQTRHNYMKSTLNIRLQPAPDRYYLLGVSGDYFGRYKRNDYALTSGGLTLNQREEKWERDKLKFNAQIARRYYDLVLRGGLIESGAGFGVDYYLEEDNLRLTFEMFSGDFDHNPHLRAELSYNIWKIFYISLGYDDFISDQHRATPFIGLGIQFSDDDLKYLLSGASSVL